MSLIAPDVTPAQRLIDHGMALQMRAPELAMVFGERAAALAEAAGSERLWAQAEGLAVVGRVRLGQRAGVVDRAVAVLRTAESEGLVELAAAMRVDLALCARSVGVPLTGLAALRPVLGEPDLSAGTRAAAMLQFVGCMAPLGRRRVLDRALAEAGDLVAHDGDLPEAERTLLRALVCSRAAACQRRYGDLAAALDRAREGLELLDGLQPAAADGVQLRARLVLEVICALLDRGTPGQAAELAEPLLAGPARASAAGPLAWLRLAVATRIHLPSGAAEAAGKLIRDALYEAQRHELMTVTARLWLELSHIEERLGRAEEALRCLREARVCEQAYGRVRRQALGLLIGEFGRGEQHVVDLPASTVTRQHVTQPVPPPRVQSEPTVDEPVAVAAPETREPEPPEPAPVPAEPAVEPPPSRLTSAERAARHRADGGVDARSVLERMGVSVSGGGRRRARDEEPGQGSVPVIGGSSAKSELENEPTPLEPKPQPESPPEERLEERPPERPESTVDKPAGQEPKRLDSVLAVFSNWTDDDDASAGIVAPRARRRRHEQEPQSEQMVANGRKINGEDHAAGRHRGEA